MSGDIVAENPQTLFEDLIKFKRQNAILKKAVLNEQEKTTNLESVLKEKEVKVQSITEENDLLNFNNQRLTKQVSQLQELLNQEKERKSEVWSGGGSWFFSTSSKSELDKKGC